MTADADKRAIIIDIGERPPKDGEKYYSPAEKKIEGILHEIAQRNGCNVNRNIILKKTYLRPDLIEKGILWHQIDFAFVCDHIWTAIEVDGESYHSEEKDSVKDLELIHSGWNIIRVDAKMLKKHLKEVSVEIESFVASKERCKYKKIHENEEEKERVQLEDEEWKKQFSEFEMFMALMEHQENKVVNTLEEML